MAIAEKSLVFDWSVQTMCFSQWHALSRSEQSKYYDLAQKERLLHMQLYPGWSARDNYVCCYVCHQYQNQNTHIYHVYCS